MKQADIETAAGRLADELLIEQAQEALVMVPKYRAGDEPIAHMTWGMPIRNYLRHWGLAPDDDTMDEIWPEILERAATLRLSEGYEPTTRNQTRDLREDDWASKQLHSTWLAVVACFDDGTNIGRLFEFFEDGTYVQITMTLNPDGTEDLAPMEFGLYDMGASFISIAASIYQGEPLPAGGAPFMMPLSVDGKSFEFCDWQFDRVK